MNKFNSGGTTSVLGIAFISASLATLYLDSRALFWFVLLCGCGGIFLITYSISLRHFVVKGLINMAH